MHRFFIDKSNFENKTVIFPYNTSHQIANVLRLKENDEVIVLDNSGVEYTVSLTSVNTKLTKAIIISTQTSVNEPEIKLHLYFSLTQREKFEFILQKCTEIGVSVFHPFVSSRSLSGFKKSDTKKVERWRKILIEASEQSKRGLIPELREVVNFNVAVTEKGNFDHKFFAWEQTESLVDIKNLLRDIHPCNNIALFIGPEGGFSQSEADLASELDWRLVSLGKRTMRMETAAIVASALILLS